VTAGAHRLRLPLVVKPADASGSKGTLLVSERHRIPGAVAHAQEHSHTDTVVAEEFVTGRHLSIAVGAAHDPEAITPGYTARRITP
jgi:biotin carboxylase